MNIVLNYITTNLLNGKQYIGMHSTNNINDSYLGTGKLILRAIKKYGRRNFKRDILFVLKDKRKAFDNEVDLIKEYNTVTPNGYNISPSGGFGLNHVISEETRQKMSKSRIGKSPWNRDKKLLPLSKEHKRKISEAGKGKNNYMYGKKHSKETKNKMSESKMGHTPWNKGIETLEEVKKKLSKSHQGQHSSPRTEFKKGRIPWNVKKDITKDFLYNEYCLKKKSSLIIAKEISVCKGTILNYLKRFNIPSRTPSEAIKILL